MFFIFVCINFYCLNIFKQIVKHYCLVKEIVLYELSIIIIIIIIIISLLLFILTMI